MSEATELKQCCCIVAGTSTRCQEWGKPEGESNTFTCDAHLGELEFWLNHYTERARKVNQN